MAFRDEVSCANCFLLKIVHLKIWHYANASQDIFILPSRFRLDLYYRLGVFVIHVPPLRERREDIPLLAENILKRESGGDSIFLVPEAINQLLSHHWPGNVRELENVLKKAMVICGNYKIKAEAITFDDVIPYDSNNLYSENNLVLQRYRQMVEGKKSFWDVVYRPFLQRELKREEVAAIIKMGLKEAGTYRRLMELFNAGRTEQDYKRFMKALTRHGINPHFRGTKSP